MHTIHFLIRLVEYHQILTYGLIYLGMVFEGEFFLICTGTLMHLGALNFCLAVAVVLLGAFSKTIIGYALGEFLFKKFNHNKFFKYIQKRVYTILPGFKSKPFWSIFASKFIMGANNVVIMFSGFEKINYKKFFKAEIFSTVIWLPMMLALGYFFSYTALRVSHNIWKFLIVILILFIIYIIFDRLVGFIYELFEEYYNEHS
jgi:membrane protein DedA with SNARE-associated domain